MRIGRVLIIPVILAFGVTGSPLFGSAMSVATGLTKSARAYCRFSKPRHLLSH